MTKVSDWLAENVDSHGIYDITLLDDIPEPVRYDSARDELSAPSWTRTVIALGSRTAKSMAANEGAIETGNPKGAYLDPDTPGSARLFGGHELSYVLDRLLTGQDAGGAYFGRGTSHRARIAHLAQAGF